ncbi:MAG: Clp protease N-terminal domain-containing protein [Terriglobales bacterium]
MFERYTEKARRVIFFSRYEASQFGSPYIETEHLLLGLLRENQALTRLVLPSTASVEAFRKEITERTPVREKTSTSIDLELSNESKCVLAYAVEEAEGFGHKHIGSEHLLLGLLRKKNGLAAHLLNARGLSLERASEIVSKGHSTAGQAEDIVQIHGEAWDLSYVRAQLVELRRFAWRKRPWKPLDTLVEINSDRIFFDLSGPADPGFKLLTGGWPREFCAVCHWELGTEGGPEHSEGFTNGREWLCTECYERFLEPKDKAE